MNNNPKYHLNNLLVQRIPSMNYEKKVKVLDWFEDQMKKKYELRQAMLSNMNRHQRRKYFAKGRRQK
jgi:hypothetical protein